MAHRSGEPADVRHRARQAEARSTPGYLLDASGNRLDKEGKPISLQLVMPDYDPNYRQVAASSSRTGSRELGIKVSPRSYDSDTLGRPDAPAGGRRGQDKANYDLFIWDWAWGPDPNDPLSVFQCDAIGSSSTACGATRSTTSSTSSRSCAKTPEERKAILDQMQQMWYDEAPYHILYYDDNLARLPDRQVRRLAEPAGRTGRRSSRYGTLG